jgi:hypothetical protein
MEVDTRHLVEPWAQVQRSATTTEQAESGLRTRGTGRAHPIPEGVVFADGEVRTARTSLLYGLLGALEVPDNRLASPTVPTSNQVQRWLGQMERLRRPRAA